MATGFNTVRNLMWDTFVAHCDAEGLDLDDLDYDTWLEERLFDESEAKADLDSLSDRLDH